jgi:lysophospholipase L1-like esterase
MVSKSVHCSSPLIVSFVLLANTVLGQSLSILKEDKDRFRIEASAPQQTRHALQVSKDLSLWLASMIRSGSTSNMIAVIRDTQRYFRLVPWFEPPNIRIALLGDSTVADLASNLNYFDGWGQGMYLYSNANAQFFNLASPGLGTKNFLGSDQEARMLALKPDYVLVDLCYEDAFGPVDRATTLQEYEANLRTIVLKIRGFGRVPILLTPQGLWIFNDQGLTGPAYPERNGIIQKVAADLQVDLIDLSTLSINLFNRLGKNGSQFLFADWLHFTDQGAAVIAELVVNALPGSFGRYLVTEKVLTF